MYENITGIRTDPENPGFKHIILQPRILDSKMNYARCEYQSPHGLIKSYWQLKGETLVWKVTVPPNTTATAYIFTDKNSRILESSIPVEDSTGVEFLKYTENAAVYDLKSGHYQFEVRN